MGVAINAFKDDNFRLGDLQVITYDRKRTDIFTPDYLGTLYSECARSGTLQNTFCGMSDLSYATIFSYLASRPVTLMVKWISDTQFVEAGFLFPTVVNGVSPEKAVFCGYTGFRTFWGTRELDILGMLALASFFVSNNAVVLHGLRYDINDRSSRYLEQYGFVDTGFVPRYMLRDGKLVSTIVSSLLIEEFEEKVAERLIALTDDDPLVKPTPESRMQLTRRSRNRTPAP